MLMAWGEQTQLVERFHAVTSFLKQTCKHWELGVSYEGWVTALAREKERLVPLVIQRLRRQMQSMKDYQRCGRWEAYAVDGSEFACPRTLENQQAMGDVGKPDGMPLVSLTTLHHLRLGLPWALRVGPGTDSERAHLRDMADELPAGSLLVADAGFVGYDLCRSLLARKQHFLLRVGGRASRDAQRKTLSSHATGVVPYPGQLSPRWLRPHGQQSSTQLPAQEATPATRTADPQTANEETNSNRETTNANNHRRLVDGVGCHWRLASVRLARARFPWHPPGPLAAFPQEKIGIGLPVAKTCGRSSGSRSFVFGGMPRAW